MIGAIFMKLGLAPTTLMIFIMVRSLLDYRCSAWQTGSASDSDVLPAQQPCRVPDHHGIGLHVVQHYTAHADQASIADADAISHSRIRADVAGATHLDHTRETNASRDARVIADHAVVA